MVAGYNVQIAVDDRHKLIVASNVVNDGNDSGQLHEMAMSAKEALGVETLQAAADGGYYNGDTLRACEADDIVAYVPEADKNKRLAKQGRFTLKDFAYDAQADVYRCPAGAELRPMEGYKQDVGGKLHVRYSALQSVCGVCPLRSRCLTEKARRREVHRWQHQDVIDRHRARMAEAAAALMMRRRAALAEHPFGTLKCRAGYRHFLLRGLHKVRGEWSLMALCYNFGRVLSILGLDRFLAYLAKNCPNRLNLLFASPHPPCRVAPNRCCLPLGPPRPGQHDYSPRPKQRRVTLFLPSLLTLIRPTFFRSPRSRHRAPAWPY